MMTPTTPPSTCPACGALVPANFPFTACPTCGAPLTGPGQDAAMQALSPAQRANLESLAVRSNEKLFEAGAEVAERAFNLSCGMSVLLVVAAGGLVYFLAGRNWILALITVIMATLAALWVIVLVSDLSKTSAMRRIFQDEVGVEINDYARVERIHRERFDEIAHASLSPTAPLLRFIPPLPAPEEEDEAEG